MIRIYSGISFFFCILLVLLPGSSVNSQENILQNRTDIDKLTSGSAYNIGFRADQNANDIVALYGQLQVIGNKIANKNGDPVALRGMSFFWSQWIGKYYNYDCVKWLRDDWKCTVVRAAMAIENGGYLTNPLNEYAKIATVIEACIDLGIYVIVDWHDHHAQQHTERAVQFFRDIAAEYGDTPNIIYEIYNEPEPPNDNWTNDIKPYADSVIAAIRSVDPDNLIIVGTPSWSQNVDVAALNPLPYNNIAYSLHFYAATHKQALRNKAITALNRGIALFVSEWGTCEASGSGKLDYAEVENWSAFMDQNLLSWCNWSIADKNETAAALKTGASATGEWTDSDLTPSGQLLRSKIISWDNSLSTELTSNIHPIKMELHQNYPNPFNPVTNLGFQISQLGHVQIKVYDIMGRETALLVNEEMPAGEYNIQFDGSQLASGIYYYQLKSGNVMQTKKMVLLR